MMFGLPTRMEYRYAAPAERRKILKLWREYNSAMRVRLARGELACNCFWAYPESHDDYLYEISRQRRLDAMYVEPRGFNDRLDGVDVDRGVRTGAIEPWEYGE